MELAALRRLRRLKETIVAAAHTAASFASDKWLDAIAALRSIVRGRIDTAINQSPYLEVLFKNSLLSNITDGVNFMLTLEGYGSGTCNGQNIFFATPKPIPGTSLYQCFQNCNILIAATIVGAEKNTAGYDTGRVTDMRQMFDGCAMLRAVDASEWDTSSATTLARAFGNCKNLKYCDTSNWNLGNVTSFDYVFYNCSSLTSLDVSSWDVGKVTTLSYAFYGCSGLTTLDVSGWKLPTNVSMVAAFSGCSNLEEIDMSGWTCALSLQATFSGCTKLKSLDFRNMIVSPTTIQNGLSSCVSLTSIKGLNLSNLILTGENITQTSFMAYSTYSAYNLPSLTDCILEGTLYRYISIAYMPNLDIPSLRSWFDALYDWYENAEGKTSYEVAYVSGNRGDMTSCPTFVMTLNQLARLDAAKTDASDGAGYYLMTALDKGWVFPDSITNSAVVEGYLEEYENYLLSL